MERWEYLLYTGTISMTGKAAERFDEALNDLGRAGWEAVNFQHDGRLGKVLLKRRLEEG